jgi:hypothetical protein
MRCWDRCFAESQQKMACWPAAGAWYQGCRTDQGNRDTAHRDESDLKRVKIGKESSITKSQ